MHRFLGSKSGKAKPEAPSISDVTAGQAKRIEELRGRIGKLDSELVKYREQMKKTVRGVAHPVLLRLFLAR
jgi:hypothetical protein|eukprot:SAG25_NODE_1686_length_2554_cov_1.591039_4_plen_71_part_00